MKAMRVGGIGRRGWVGLERVVERWRVESSRVVRVV